MFKNSIKNLAKGTNNSFRQIFYGREIRNSGGPFFGRKGNIESIAKNYRPGNKRTF